MQADRIFRNKTGSNQTRKTQEVLKRTLDRQKEQASSAEKKQGRKTV